jgi:hypothetical protein
VSVLAAGERSSCLEGATPRTAAVGFPDERQSARSPRLAARTTNSLRPHSRNARFRNSATPVEQERHGPDAGARGMPRLGLAFPRRRLSLPFRARFGSEGSARGRVDALVAIVPANAIPRRGIAAQHFLNDTGAGSAAR